MAGTVGLLVAGPRLRGTPRERQVSVVLAWGNLVFGVTSSVLGLFPFRVHHSLPLQICDIAWIFVAWALLTQRPLPTALTYYWGLTLSVQALVQPTLTQAFPDPNFFVFWAKHVLIVWGAVYLCLALRHGPDWSSYRRAVAWTFGWLVVVLVPERPAGLQLRLRQRQAVGGHGARRPRPVAGVRRGRDGDHPGRLGADHPALDRMAATPIVRIKRQPRAAAFDRRIDTYYRTRRGGSGDDDGVEGGGGVADAYVDLVADGGTRGPCGRNSIEACMCGGSANSRCLPSTVNGDRTKPTASRPPRARVAARARIEWSPVGASRPMPWAVPPETTRMWPAFGAVRPR